MSGVERMGYGQRDDTSEMQDFLDELEGFERDFDLEDGVIIRHLTEVLRRHRTFGGLRRQLDVRLQ